MASIVNRVNFNKDPGLAHCWTLEKLLDESQLTGELNLSGRNLKEYPEYAKQCDMGDTVVADLSRNKFVEIPCEICNYCSMEWLNCYSNTIKYIPNSIIQLLNLVYLNLSRNQLSAIPPSLCRLTQLQVLIASHNRLTDLPDELNQLICLSELDVSCNEISHMPDNWEGLQTLRRLDIRRNCLTDLPIGLSGLQLQFFNMSCNSITRLPTEFHRLVLLEEFRIEYNPLVFPPQHVCRKGLNHVLKFLAMQAAQQQNKHNVRAKYKRPSALLANHFENTSRSCENFDQCYITSHVVESGYSTADSYEKLRLPSCEDSSETPCKNDYLRLNGDCIQDECQRIECYLESQLIVDKDKCIQDECQQTECIIESQLIVDKDKCIQDECQRIECYLESQLIVDKDKCIQDECQQTECIIESQLIVDKDKCIQDECQQTECILESQLIVDKDKCIQDECQQTECIIESQLIVDKDKCIQDECQQTECIIESQLIVDEDKCIQDECQRIECYLESQLIVDEDKCIQDECQQTECILESELVVENDNCIQDKCLPTECELESVVDNDNSFQDECQQIKSYLDHWSSDMSIMKTEPLLADSRHIEDTIPVPVMISKYFYSPGEMNVDSDEKQLSYCTSDAIKDSVESRLIHCTVDDFYCQTTETLRSLIELNLNIKLSADLSSAVSDGVVLCQLANHIRPNSVSHVNISTQDSLLTSSQCKANVRLFLQACRNIGVRKCYLCSCEDVVDGLQHPERLLSTVQQLLSYRPVTITDHIVSVFCLIVFCFACTLLVYFPLPD